ncbi:nucleoside phosphatase family-domain-containing protein [Lipomyces arxii]|uniref:nucleoside phosphatase family-domain-containing protein n=1 Tax=Lipomyces arxii TaxID=56418 RepID=UPI0034D01C7C
MSFPPSADADGIRRRPNIFSFLSFRTVNDDSVNDSSFSFDKSPSPSKSQSRHISLIEAAKSRIGKTLIFGTLLLVALFVYLSPSASVTKFVGEQKLSDLRAGSYVPEVATDGTCVKSHDGKKPVTQYALMVDAGSTGSRIHVYQFTNCQETPELVNEVFEMTKPGLSSYPDNPQGAAESLDPLLAVAMKSVPDDFKACTPIALKATAGLRLLGDEKSQKILDVVRAHLETKYPFPVVGGDGVSIMGGNDEGVYAWITTNFLLGNIGSKEDRPTAAIFDLGGGSTQIVFEPTFPISEAGVPQQMTAGDHKYELSFGGRDFTLYQHSHLGYGLMEARKKVHAAVLKNAMESSSSKTIPKLLVNPCLPPGMRREVEVEVAAGNMVKVNMTGPVEPSATQCRFLTEQILRKEAECPVEPCSFNGVHQPSLSRTFAKEDIFIFSYFYDRTFPLGMPHSFSLSELRDLTGRVCKGQEGWDGFSAFPGALEELEDRPEWCLDLNFMISILHSGYDIPLDREVKIAKKLKGNELGWCLGASLPLLDQGTANWSCQIKQVS